MAVRIKCPTTGKDVYFSMPDATRSAQSLSAKRNLDLSVYRCPQCTFLHLTKTRQVKPQ